MPTTGKLSNDDYRRLSDFRTAIRKFLSYSKEQAALVGLTPTQHQLLLAIRGHPGTDPPTIRDIAERLLIRHHSAGELIDRAEQAGLVEKRRDADDSRVVRLFVTRSGASKLERISTANLREISRLSPELQKVWKAMKPFSE